MIPTSVLYRVPSSFIGRPTRQVTCNIIESRELDQTQTWVNRGIGQPVVFSATGLLQPVSATTTSGDIAGIIASQYPMSAGIGTNNAWGTQDPAVLPDTTFGLLMVSGYIGVYVQNGNPVAGGKVYVRVSGTTSQLVVGGFETASSTDTILMTNAVFSGGVDENGIAEIRFNKLGG